MKRCLVLFAAFLAAFSVLSCSPTYNSIKRMQKMEEGVSNPTTKEELEEAIKKYDARAMDLVLTEGQIGIWYKILGTRYQDQQMYGKALECFQKALMYYPDNANLYFYVGSCAGHLSHAFLDFEAKGAASSNSVKKMNYLKLAESSYLQALKLNPNYYRVLFGLGVLYVYEFGQGDKAIPYLEKFLSVQTRDTEAMFALAAAYYLNYEFEKAIPLYDRIIELKPNAQKVQEAKSNKTKVLSLMYKE
ncbi:tetratricopeptide repeat protein [Treponema sp.]|uniref:tetratricopeptide repeat protein n=1 Tax=Treponema sp. TaxID=166 RepID=UPI003F06BBCC